MCEGTDSIGEGREKAESSPPILLDNVTTVNMILAAGPRYNYRSGSDAIGSWIPP